MSALIGALRVTLGMDSAAFERGARDATTTGDKMKTGLTKVAGAIGAAFAGLQLVEFAQQWKNATIAALDTAGALGETAQQLGVTTDALQEYRYAATQAGVEQAEMDKALGQLTKRLGEAAQGAKGPTDALKLLGITLADVRGKTTGDVMPMIAEGLKRVASESERAAILTDLFGRAGQKLVPLLAEGAAGVDGLRRAAHEAGLVISEELIVGADGASDRLAQLYAIVEAKKNVQLLNPDNVEAVMAYEEAIADLQITMYTWIGSTAKFFKETALWHSHFKPWALQLGEWMGGASKQVGTAITNMMNAIGDMVMYVPRQIGAMVSAVSNWLGTQLDAVWKRVTDKVAAVKAAFFSLYDAVVGHSYIPDMVDGIAAEMARLDGVMVAPVTAATSKAQEAFRSMAANVRGLMDRLFPEVRAAMDFDATDALINQLPAGLQDEARRRQWSEFVTGSPHGAAGPTADFSNDAIDQKDEEGFERFTRRMDAVIDKAAEARVRVAKSFKDMAEDTLGSLGRLTSAIKGGGFLDILQAVVGFGLQLGGMGAFGKSIQGRINASVPSYAGGTNFHPGGLAMVGERGPELVSMPRGSKVFSNDNSRGMMGGGRVEIVDTTGLFRFRVNGQIMEAAPSLVDAGGSVGVAKMQHKASRRWR
jgi:hypothetical protein